MGMGAHDITYRYVFDFVDNGSRAALAADRSVRGATQQTTDALIVQTNAALKAAQASVRGAEQAAAAGRTTAQAYERAAAAAKASASESVAAAKLKVQGIVREREALMSAHTAYVQLARAAKQGSEQQVAANKLAADSAHALGVAYKQAAGAGLLARSGGRGGHSQFTGSAAAEERGIGRGFLSRASGVGGWIAGPGFIAGAVAGIATVKIVKDTLAAQESQKLLQNALQVSGISWKRNEERITETLHAQEKVSGFSKTELRSSLGVLVRATHDLAGAQRLEADAANVARGRHIALQAASLLMTKAYMGNTGALRRLGIDVARATPNMDALVKAHIKVTDANRAQVQQLKEHAKAMDKQVTQTVVLETVEKRYHGAAAAYTSTLQGRLDALRNTTEDLAVTIGTKMVPKLAAAADWLNRMMVAAQHNKTVLGVLHATGKLISVVWTGLATIVQGLAAALRNDMVKAVVVLTGVVFALNAAMAINPWVAAAAAAVIAVGVIRKHWGAIREFFLNLWRDIKDAAAIAFASIKVAGLTELRLLLEPFSHLPGWAGQWARDLKDQVNQELDKAKQSISDHAYDMMHHAGSSAKAGWNAGIKGWLDPRSLGMGAAPAPGTASSPYMGAPGTGGAASATVHAGQQYFLNVLKARGWDRAQLAQAQRLINYEDASGRPGDHNTSFGPRQLHAHGQLPASVWARGPAYAQRWAWSTQGLAYAANAIAGYGGLHGTALAHALAVRQGSTNIPAEEAAMLGGGGGGATADPAQAAVLARLLAAQNAAAAKKASDKAAKAALRVQNAYLRAVEKTAAQQLATAVSGRAAGGSAAAEYAGMGAAVTTLQGGVAYAEGHGLRAAATDLRTRIRVVQDHVAHLLIAAHKAVVAAYLKHITGMSHTASSMVTAAREGAAAGGGIGGEVRSMTRAEGVVDRAIKYASSRGLPVAKLKAQRVSIQNAIGAALIADFNAQIAQVAKDLKGYGSAAQTEQHASRAALAGLRAKGIDPNSPEGLAVQEPITKALIGGLRAQQALVRKELLKAQKQHLPTSVIDDIKQKLLDTQLDLADAVATLAEQVRVAAQAAAQAVVDHAAAQVGHVQAGLQDIIYRQQIGGGGYDAHGSWVGGDQTAGGLTAQANYVSGMVVPALQGQLNALNNQLGLARGQASYTKAGEITTSSQQAIDAILQNIDSVTSAILGAQAQSSDLLRQAAEAAKRAAEDAAQAVVDLATHGATMAGLGEQHLELQQQLAGTFDTVQGGAARAEYIKAYVIPALQAEVEALMQQQQVATGQGDTTLANQIAEAIAAKQNEIDQQSLQALQDINSHTEDMANALKQFGGGTAFDYGGQLFTDSLVGV